MAYSETPYEVLPGVLDIPGVGVGCIMDVDKVTGVTVVLLPEGCKGGVDVAGGAPATRETDLLNPINTVPGPDAVVLTGGSALGLETADGVTQALRSMGRGVEVASVRVPIVSAAAIFDLAVGKPEPPTRQDGMDALNRAARLSPILEEGSFGAGTGATVGKSLGAKASMKGGQGAVTLRTRDGLLVGAIVVVNAVGSVLDENGLVLAGPLAEGVPRNTTDMWALSSADLREGEATTIGVVVTNGDLSKACLCRVARMAHDGLARSIEPIHTPWDGDTLFALSVGNRIEEVGRIGALAARAVAMAVRRAIRAANPSA